MIALPYIPDYIVESVLGEGGMATVYLGIQQKLQRRVAIKVLDPALLKNKILADRFMIEAQTSANLNHPNIISIFDVGQVGKYYYIVMELLDGSLKDLIKSSRSRKLPAGESLNIISKIAPALDYAHKQGIIHRDIKPDNIMFRQDGTPVLVDFGIARAVDTNLEMTKTGMGIGTPHYMSPEQCQTGPLDGRSDFYSLGVVLYELLTGEKPYRAETIMAVALKQIQEPVPKLPATLAKYQPLLDKMMAKNKEDRIQNGSALQRLINKVLWEPQPTQPQSAQPTQPTQPGIDADEEDSPYVLADMETATDPALDLKAEAAPVEPVKPVEPVIPVKPAEPAATTSAPETPAAITSREITKRMAPEEPPVPEWFKESLERTAPREIPVEPISRKLYKETAKKKSPSPLFVVILVAVSMLTIFAYFFYQGLVSEEKGKGGESSPQQNINAGGNTSPVKTGVSPNNKTQSRDNSLTGPETPGKIENKEAGASKGNAAGKIPGMVTPTPPAMSDEDTFKNAATQNTVAAYRKYLEDYPSGRHFNEAMTKIEQLKEGLTLQDLTKAKPKPSYSLRTVYRALNAGEVETMIKRYGFYDGNINPAGRFKNDFENKTVNGNPVIIDHKTGLMWHPGGSDEEVEQKKIPRWLKDLNSKRYAGYSDWRLPTLVEGASLLRGSKNSKGLYTDPLFSGDQKRIWTGDPFEGNNLWVVRFYTGIVLGSEGAGVHFIRPVRAYER